jgi:hypothetical protein
VGVLHYGFAINDCRFARELGSSADNAGIAVTPITSVAAEQMRLAALNHHMRAVAIMLDFVNPVLPLWRLIDWRSKLWLDEPETRRHSIYLASSLFHFALILFEDGPSSLQIVGKPYPRSGELGEMIPCLSRC